MNKTVICPGSFDPVTLGHLDIITRAAKMFDRVIVAVLVNSAKTPTFSTEERIELLREAVGGLENVEIVSFKGLLAEYCKKCGVGTIVKGLRAVSDFRLDLPQLEYGSRNRLNGRRHQQFRSRLRARQNC